MSDLHVLCKEAKAQDDELPDATANVLTVGSPSKNEKPPKSEKGPDAGHGNRFQSKLLVLFCIRAINAEYKFYLGTELAEQGKKFDDLIFKYTKDKNAENTGNNWPYQYLQAKHRLYEKRHDLKITADDLFHVSSVKGKAVNADFNLPKYFRSYCEITRRGDKIDSCIICTNIDFANKKSLRRDGIEVKEVQLSDPILKFEKLSDDKIPRRYKIEILHEYFSDILKEETTSKLLANKLWDSRNRKINLNSKSESIRNYHVALVEENVIDLITHTFHIDFISGCNELSEGAKELRQNILRLSKNVKHLTSLIFSFDTNFGKTSLKVIEFHYPLPVAVKNKEIEGFLDKLVFAVNTPNEDELDDVLKGEVSNYFKLLSTDLQSAYVMNEMVNWFKRENNVWLSSEEAKELFLNKTQKIMDLIRVNEISMDYQHQLKKDLIGLEFNSDAIQVMTDKLRLLLESTYSNSVIIGTESPRHTAVKIFAAIKSLPDFRCDDSFLVTSSKRLEDEMEMKKWKNCLKLKKTSHNLLVIVCDSEVSLQNYANYVNLIPDFGTPDKKINKAVILCPDKTARIIDEIKFTDLTDEFKQKILTLKISFQVKKSFGQQEIEQNKITVGDLIGDKPEEVIDFRSIKELTQTGHDIKIPSFDNSDHFEEHMYIKRNLKYPYRDKFEDELAKSLDCSVNQLREECKIFPDGHIEWLVKKGERQTKIWHKIKDVANQSPSSSGKFYKDNHLICKKKSVVIISGIAGSGKSTLLSYCYREIKRDKPDYWIIRINFMDHHKAILKLDNFAVVLDEAYNFFVNELHVVDDKSLFSCSLLRNRLATGDRIAFMFDGFDEINDQCQKKAIQLMKAIIKENIQLYVTTRPHMLDDLQLQLFELPYNLENIKRIDQIEYLTKFWQKNIDLPDVKISGTIQQFAETLVDKISNSLKDTESSFIGIPLQCRIIGECFRSEVLAITRKKHDENGAKKLMEDRFDNKMLDLANLYESLMETKRRVFREEKTKTPVSSGYSIEPLMKEIENHLTKLAIKTIITDQKVTEILWPKQSSHRSDEDVVAEENTMALNGLKFGLTFKREDNKKVQFLHQTYAEYLFARYLYKGFLLDEMRHNKLLENESIRMLILNKILARPEYDGVQVFLNSMLKDLVDDDKEWRSRINRRDLPVRLKKFTKNFYNRFFGQDSPPKLTVDHLLTTDNPSSHRYDFENALHFSLWTGKQMIFTFLCDCLNANFDKKLVQLVMMKSFMHTGSYFTFKFFRNTESKLFERFIGYFNSDADTVLSKLTHIFWNLPPCDLEYSQWNGEEQTKTVYHLLQYLNNQRKAFDKYFSTGIEETEQNIEPMLTFFIFNENYESHLKLFLELLSRSTAYSGDFQFASLLKKAFCSKKYFRSGRIEKALSILCDGLGRFFILVLMRNTVLKLEPAAFQRIYKPVSFVMEEGVKSMDLNILMKPDVYGLTRLHGAAFFGNTEAVEEIFENIRQNLTNSKDMYKNDTDRVVNQVIAWDTDGLTPFYVAAACGQDEICHKMLAFLKETLQVNMLEIYLSDAKGFVHPALHDAIESENIKMFEIILKAVKRELGRNELNRILRISLLVLNATLLPEFKISNSLLVKRETKELFNAMAKIFVMRNDNVADYTDMYDFFFHDFKGKQNLKYIDAENLQGLMLLKGVEYFTKQLLDSTNLYSFGFPLLAGHLLRHFNKDQLEQFVETITRKNNLQEIERRTQNSFFTISSAERSNKSRNSYWGDLITTAAELNFTYCIVGVEGYSKLEVILDIFDCLKYASDDSLKKLLLHEEEKGFIMIQLSIEAVKRMLTYLSIESQEEVKRKWKDNAPPMDTFFASTIKLQNDDGIIFTARYWTNILRFYLHYGSVAHLEECFHKITSLRNIGVERRSVWSYIFEHCNKEETNEILKLVSVKADILGRDVVKTMLLHKVDEIPLIIKAMVWGEEMDARLEILPNEIREEIKQFVEKNAPAFIDQAFLNPQTYFNIYISQYYYNRLNILISFLNYSNEHQLQKFVQNITSLHFVIRNKNNKIKNKSKITGFYSAPIQQEQTFSLWAELFAYDCNDYKTENIAKMGKFMKCVSEKLGSNAVKELLLHKDDETPVICYPALRREKKMLRTLINYLTIKDQKMVQRQIDKFLNDDKNPSFN